MAIEIPHQRLYECSARFRESLEANDVTIEENPQSVILIGQHVLSRVLPELDALESTRMGVTASSVVQLHQGDESAFMNAEFVAEIARVQFSELEAMEFIEGLGGLVIPRTDIMLVFKQRIEEADPVDLAYSDEIVVPISEMTSLTVAM